MINHYHFIHYGHILHRMCSIFMHSLIPFCTFYTDIKMCSTANLQIGPLIFFFHIHLNWNLWVCYIALNFTTLNNFYILLLPQSPSQQDLNFMHNLCIKRSAQKIFFQFRSLVFLSISGT